MADLPCPNCGTPLTYLEQYRRHYCLRCGQYAPEGYGDRGARRCPTCGGVLSFVSQYGRFYCYHCNMYAPGEPAPAAESPANPAEPAAVPASPGTDLVVAPSAPQAPLVATPTPAVATTAQPAPTPEPSPGPVPEAETKLDSAVAAPIETPGEPAPTEKPAEPIPAPPSPEIRRLAASKPAIVRVKIFTLKKSELMDLSRAYRLDDSGTKEQVQERLLSYLHGLETEGAPPSMSESPEATPAPVLAPTPEPASPVEPAAPSISDSSVGVAATASAAVVQLEKPAAAPEAPGPEPTRVVVEVPRATPKPEHPCPTCGRELTFISQYDRYYCYFCQRYAPAARAKGACPSCGATMRWIDQHQRWWCDSCQKYAPADLPKPAHAIAAPRATASATAMPASRPAVVIHHHANPAMGMGMIGLGLVLWVFVEFFAVIAPAANLGIGNPFTDLTAALTVFFAFIFVAVGMLLGLSSLRDRF